MALLAGLHQGRLAVFVLLIGPGAFGKEDLADVEMTLS